MDARAKGVAVGLAWFFLVGAFAAMSSLAMVFMHSGGVTSPGRIWGMVLAACAFGTPPVVALAGIPLAYRIYNEQPALKVGLVTLAATLAIFATSWIAPLVARVL